MKDALNAQRQAKCTSSIHGGEYSIVCSPPPAAAAGDAADIPAPGERSRAETGGYLQDSAGSLDTTLVYTSSNLTSVCEAFEWISYHAAANRDAVAQATHRMAKRSPFFVVFTLGIRE